MEQCESVCTTGDPLPGAIQGAVAAAMAGGVTMDAIVARVGARSGEGSGSDEGLSATCMDDLIGVQREAEGFAEEWRRTREPGAEGHSARVAIETLRALTFRTVAQLGGRAESVSTMELGRLSLALQRIKGADRLRIEREQAAAEADAQGERPAPWAGLSHDEQVQTIRRSIEENLLGWPARAEAPDSGWNGDSGGDPGATPPAPAPDAPLGDGGAPEATDQEDATVAEDASDASEAPDERDAGVSQDVRAVPDAPDDDAYSVARDVELRRRDRGRLLWPTDPPFCPSLWHTFG